MIALLLGTLCAQTGTAPPDARAETLEQVPSNAVLVDRIAAVVNEDIITLSEVRTAAAPLVEPQYDAERVRRLHQDVLENLISQTLVDQQLDEANIQVTDAELDRSIADILQQNNLTQEQLEQAILARGMTMKDYREQVREDLRRQQLFQLNVNHRIQVSEKDVKEEYERLTRDDPERLVVNLSHFLFRIDGDQDESEAVASAEAAIARVQAGEPFEAVAQDVSQGPTAASGGKLGELSTQGLLPSLARVVEKLPAGQLSQPVVTPNGVHVLLVTDRRVERERTYAEMSGKIRLELMQKAQQDQIEIWLNELKSRASIDRRL